MCGILGAIKLAENGTLDKVALTAGLNNLSRRGPDFKDFYIDNKVYLGHTRLSIIDTSANANQPFRSDDGRYLLIYNGEIFNYRSLKSKVNGQLYTDSDTEVLLHLLIQFKEEAIKMLNGFFAFCFYDLKTNQTIVARDRYGIKPLVYSEQDGLLLFSSELKGIQNSLKNKDIDKASLVDYFKFNYIAAPYTIYKDVYKLLPGSYIKVNNENFTIHKYYEINQNLIGGSTDSYNSAVKNVKELVYSSVKDRLIADVPLGSFLSGGVDSSIVSAVAMQESKSLSTFSIGFKNEPQFDESRYAEQVANHIQSSHHTFKLTHDDLLSQYESAINYLDEPFADSSALNLFILSKYTKEHVTVALSGDGADELFSGYNKHLAFDFTLKKTFGKQLIKNVGGISALLPQGRNGKLANKIRQINKLNKGLKLSSYERYIEWASFMDSDLHMLLTKTPWTIRNRDYLSNDVSNINDFLYNDFKLVLEGDMLKKVDFMSMANSFEVRPPFLDSRLVDYVFSLPSEYKLTGNTTKRILRDAFRDELPEEVFKRSKKGFEIPLLRWFKNELASELDEYVFNRDRIESYGIINYEGVEAIKKSMYSSNAKDSVYNVWALYVFSKWYSNYFV